MALALSAVHAGSAEAASLSLPDPYKDLQSIVSGRTSAAPEGLFKGFQKSKQTLSQAPQKAASQIKAIGKGPSLGQGLKEAFTTSPPQIAQKAAAPVLGKSKSDTPTLLAAGAAALGIGAITVAGQSGAGSKAKSGAKAGANQLKARVQGPARQASKSQPVKQASKSAPAKAAGAFGTQARKLAASAAPGTQRVSRPQKPGTQPSGGLFGTKKVQGGGTSKVRAGPAAAQKKRGGQAAKKEGGGNTLLITGIVGAGLVGAGVLFALLPKPDFYARNPAAAITGEAPPPLPARKRSIAYQVEKLTPQAPAPKEEKKKETKSEGGGFQLPFSTPSAPAPPAPPTPPKPAAPAVPKPQVPKNLIENVPNPADSVKKAADNSGAVGGAASKAQDTASKAQDTASKATQAPQQAAQSASKATEAPQKAVSQVAEAPQKAASQATEAPKQAASQAKSQAAKVLEQAPKPPAPSPPPPPPAVAQKPSAPSGPELKPEQAKKPQTGIPLAPPKSEASKPKTPPGPELAAGPQTKPGDALKSATARAKGAPAPTATTAAAPVKQTKASEGKSDSKSGLTVAFGIVAAIGAGLFVLSPKDNAVPAAGGKDSGAAGKPEPAKAAKSSSEGQPSGNGKSDSKPAAGKPGESTPEDIKERKSEVQDWVKDWKNRT